MRVILIGFMGVGKTSVGKKLAKKLNFDFIDTDYEIEILANKTIPDIFEQDGEKHFRKLESIILKKFIKKEDVVISTGGGIITTKENYNILKSIDSVTLEDKVLYFRLKNKGIYYILRVYKKILNHSYLIYIC